MHVCMHARLGVNASIHIRLLKPAILLLRDCIQEAMGDQVRISEQNKRAKSGNKIKKKKNKKMKKTRSRWPSRRRSKREKKIKEREEDQGEEDQGEH